jgi:hypothetical protein
MTPGKRKFRVSTEDRIWRRHRGLLVIAREWVCRLLRCSAFDRSASLVVDAALADRDRLAEEVRELHERNQGG